MVVPAWLAIAFIKYAICVRFLVYGEAPNFFVPATNLKIQIESLRNLLPIIHL
jgi:hypothetical protein